MFEHGSTSGKHSSLLTIKRLGVTCPWMGWLSTARKTPALNRPLALRGHVTNASFKQRVVILSLPKIERTHKNYLTPKIWEETHLREIFYGTLIFQQSSKICIGRHVGGQTLALKHGSQNYFLLISCQMFNSYVQMCYKSYHIILSTFSFKCKICVRKW